MKFKNLLLITISLIISCKDTSKNSPQSFEKVEFKNKAHELIYEMTQKVGDIQKLKDKKDVVYTYTYKTPDGKTDISTEKYIFHEELSYAIYHKHERTLSEFEGIIEQGYNGKEFWLKNNSNTIQDELALKRVIFNRKTNFYWFCMMQKLMDNGLIYEYIKEDTISGIIYDVIKVTFSSEDEKPTDIYQLYINKTTKLIDQFLFTVADFGVIETPFLMKLKYEEIDNILIPTQRKYTQSDWNGNAINENWINVTWTDIKFDNNLSKDMFKLDHQIDIK